MNQFLTLCVNYKKDAETVEFVRTVAALPGYRGHVLVVSNSEAQRNGPLLTLLDIESVTLARAKENLGYFGGISWGLEQYLKHNPMPEWVIVSNTDILFPDREFFEKLDHLFKKNPPAVIAPDIVLTVRSGLPSTNEHQNPYFRVRPSRVRMRAMRAVARFYPIYLIYEFTSLLRHGIQNKIGNARKGTVASRKPIPIYAPFGAFIIFHRSYFEAGGSLRYPSFLFGEEIYVAETARGLGLRVMYEPRLRVIHQEHGSTAGIASRKIAGYVRDSSEYLVRMYF